MRCIVNLSFSGYSRGEFVEVSEPALWRPYFEKGLLSEVDADGRRVVAATREGTEQDERAVESDHPVFVERDVMDESTGPTDRAARSESTGTPEQDESTVETEGDTLT